jgi:hypothetical protein
MLSKNAAVYKNCFVSDVSELWFAYFLVFRTVFLLEFFSMTDSGSSGEVKSLKRNERCLHSYFTYYYLFFSIFSKDSDEINRLKFGPDFLDARLIKMVEQSVETDGGESSYYEAPSQCSQGKFVPGSQSPVRFSQMVESGETLASSTSTSVSRSASTSGSIHGQISVPIAGQTSAIASNSETGV